MIPAWKLRNKSKAPAVASDGSVVKPKEVVERAPHVVKLTMRRAPKTWERVE